MSKQGLLLTTYVNASPQDSPGSLPEFKVTVETKVKLQKKKSDLGQVSELKRSDCV